MVLQGNLGSLSAEQVEQLVSMTHVAKTCTKVGSHTHPICVPILVSPHPRHVHSAPSLPAPIHSLWVVSLTMAWNVKTLAAQIIYFLVANHVECLDGEVVTRFFNDHHACLPPLLHGHRALVQQHTAQAHTGQTPHTQAAPGVVSLLTLTLCRPSPNSCLSYPSCDYVGGGPPLSVLHGLAKLLKHLALVMVDTQKKAPLAVRAFLPAYLTLFYDELETVARCAHEAAGHDSPTCTQAPIVSAHRAYLLSLTLPLLQHGGGRVAVVRRRRRCCCRRTPRTRAVTSTCSAPCSWPTSSAAPTIRPTRAAVTHAASSSQVGQTHHAANPRPVTPRASTGAVCGFCAPGEVAKEDEWAREAQGAVVGFFTPQRCVRLVDLLLQHLMGTRPDDVDLWLSSPEELILDEEQVRTSVLHSNCPLEAALDVAVVGGLCGW